MKKTKCYIYTRVSTAMQVDGYSLDAQKDKLKRYAAYEEMQIVGEYSDEGHSGKNIAGRPDFLRMLEDIEDGKDESKRPGKENGMVALLPMAISLWMVDLLLMKARRRQLGLSLTNIFIRIWGLME